MMRLLLPAMVCVAGVCGNAQQEANEGVFAQGRALLQQGRAQEAVAVLRPAVAAHPESEEGTYLLAYALYRTREAGLSLEMYTRAAALRPPTAEDLMAVAANYILLSDFADAAKWLTVVTERQPGNALAWYYLGRARHQEGQYAEALRGFAQALTVQPKYVRAEVGVGLAQEALGNESAAMQAYDTAIAWQGTSQAQDAQPYLSAGELLLKQGQSAAALERFRKAEERSHGNPRVFEDLGRVYERLQRWREAQTVLEQGETLDPTSSTIHFLLGTAYLRQGEGEAAKREFGLTHGLLGDQSNHATKNFDLEP